MSDSILPTYYNQWSVEYAIKASKCIGSECNKKISPGEIRFGYMSEVGERSLSVIAHRC